MYVFNFIEVNDSRRVRWDNLSREDMFEKYTLPVTSGLDTLLSRYQNTIIDHNGIDELFSNIVTILMGEK